MRIAVDTGVLVPKFPGALSALGILMSDIVKDYSRTVMLPAEMPRLERHFRELEQRGQREMRAEGLRVLAVRSLDVRYRGQGYELTLDWGRGFVKQFHAAHRRRYGYADPARAVEVVNVRVRMVAATEPVPMPRRRVTNGDSRQAVVKRRRVVFEGRAVKAPLYQRELLRPGDTFAGPANVAEYSATTVVPPGCRARMDAHENLVIEVSKLDKH